jgi:hypothetical protein
MNKTLIGKENYLFLINDTNQELNVHCNNLDLVNNEQLNKYSFHNFCLIIFPNKSLIYKDYLPDDYIVKYRPAFDKYKMILKNKMVDTYDILKKENDVYYKTDTHINIKGSYIVYKYFIQEINKLFHLTIIPKEIIILNKQCLLCNLLIGLGDLLWKQNLGEQVVDDPMDNYYYSDDIKSIYCTHRINATDNLKILDYTLTEKNQMLHDVIIDWNIISTYILYQKNKGNKHKVIIFYDSFLISLLHLYLELFEEVYMIKSIYNNDIINIINPDYVFEFRIERFLN